MSSRLGDPGLYNLRCAATAAAAGDSVGFIVNALCLTHLQQQQHIFVNLHRSGTETTAQALQPTTTNAFSIYRATISKRVYMLLYYSKMLVVLAFEVTAY